MTIKEKTAILNWQVSSGKHGGSSLVEMMIAIMMLSVVLMGMMAGIMIARSSIYDKEFENARQVALKVLETIEATPYGSIPTRANNLNNSRLDGFQIYVSQSENHGVSDDISLRTVMVSIDMGNIGPLKRIVSMRREVSPSGFKNVGDVYDL
jgi:type II secretory pathway pseudopilin PulG